MSNRFPDRVIVRFPADMLPRLDAVLKPGEDRGAFILAATAAALRRAERGTARPAATWLQQMRPTDGALRVQDYPFEVVRIACRHCPRAGRYRRSSLAERFGPALRPASRRAHR